MADSYLQFDPPPGVRPVIDAYWIGRQGEGPNRILPDGCIDLIFQNRPGGVRLFSSALIEQAAEYVAEPGTWFAGVRFRPGMSRVVLDVDPHECRGREIRAGDIDQRFSSLEDQLAGCDSPIEALQVLRAAVDRRIACNLRHVAPQRVQNALSLLGDRDIHEVARSLGISERSLYRDLVSWTGLRPKLLARIFRMQRALAQMRTGHMPLAAIAQELRYADQAHMTRDLRQLTGNRPSELVAARV